jgi:hypothetical protein
MPRIHFARTLQFDSPLWVCAVVFVSWRSVLDPGHAVLWPEQIARAGKPRHIAALIGWGRCGNMAVTKKTAIAYSKYKPCKQ